jgi:H+/Cl- antiporter ClcA
MTTSDDAPDPTDGPPGPDRPTHEPTGDPTGRDHRAGPDDPTHDPTHEPTDDPTVDPTAAVADPAGDPTGEPGGATPIRSRRRPVTTGLARARHLTPSDVLELGGVLRDLVRWIVLGGVVGVLAGVSTAGFLYTLDWATRTRLHHPWLLGVLPVAGLVVGAIYHYGGGRSSLGSNLILDEIHEPVDWIPRRMAPLIYLGTIVTVLFGGSVGREGTAIQMAGSLSDGFSRLIRLGPVDRRTMLVTALAGGFAAVFGTPVAGFVFALEVQSIGRLRYDALVPAAAAAIVADRVVRALGIHYTLVPALGPVELTPLLLIKMAVAGIAFGLTGQAFAVAIHAVKRGFDARISWAPLRPFIGGLAVIALTLAVGNQDYNGLSLGLIEASLAGGVGVVAFAFALKLVFTALTLGSGFYGGEVTPLFVIGATLGVTLGHLLGVPAETMAAVGYVAVFAGAANVPLACTVMGAEVFGAPGFVLFAVACVMSYAVSSHEGIYRSQRIAVAKPGRPGPGDGPTVT